jgi:hypothetical protein
MPVKANIAATSQRMWPLTYALLVAQACKVAMLLSPQGQILAVFACAYFVACILVVLMAAKSSVTSGAQNLLRCLGHELISAGATIMGIAFGGRLHEYFLPFVLVFGFSALSACRFDARASALTAGHVGEGSGAQPGGERI